MEESNSVVSKENRAMVLLPMEISELRAEIGKNDDGKWELWYVFDVDIPDCGADTAEMEITAGHPWYESIEMLAKTMGFPKVTPA